MPQTDKQKTGNIGEDVACKFLVKRGFTIIDRNYWKKWGEIDIVAKSFNSSQDEEILHFVEVKSVSRETLDNIDSEDYQPEDNVHAEKLKRLGRVIQTYLLDKNIDDELEWQIDIMAVFLDKANKKAKVRVTENIII